MKRQYSRRFILLTSESTLLLSKFLNCQTLAWRTQSLVFKGFELEHSIYMHLLCADANLYSVLQ